MGLLLECSIRALLMGGAVAAIIYGLRIRSATARHAAWCGVLAAMLTLPLFSAWGPKAPLRILPAVEEPAFPEPLPSMMEPVAIPAAQSQLPVSDRPAGSHLDLPLAIYLLGASLMLARHLTGTVRAAYLLRRAHPESGFFSSAGCACPVTAGWRRPRIVLPAWWKEWPHAELDAVLAHEREHVRRRDPLIQWMAALNRCIFWFHPLAWWMAHHLSSLAEEACDAAVLARGCDPHAYSEYLLNQAQAIRRAGARLPLAGPAMGGGALAGRIRRLLEQRPVSSLSRRTSLAAAALCGAAIFAFAACRLDHVEKAAPGQPSMNALMHRSAEVRLQDQEHIAALQERAHALTPAGARQLLAKLKENPQDEDTYWILVRHYEYGSDLKDLDALRLWYIEHQPAGKFWPGNIDPKFDPEAYRQGKALWLADLKRPGAEAALYERAAGYLDGGDKPLAETVLDAGRKAYPGDPRWPMAFGRHYAQALLGLADPYAQSLRARLADSKDVRVLAQTAQWLIAWDRDPASFQLAKSYADRALSLDPNSETASRVNARIAEIELRSRAMQLAQKPAVETAGLGDSDRMLLDFYQMQQAAIRENFDTAAAKARDLLALAGRNRSDALYGDSVFDANIVLGKDALHHGDRKAAAQYLLAAAKTPGSGEIRKGEFEMNLPRALVDYGERQAVADFFDRMAPKTARSKVFQDWAAQIRKGINPDLIPTFSSSSCTQDPC